MTFVLDCSHYQGTINWPQVKADGCLGAYIKVTDGATGVDADWSANHAGATANGIPVGPYHFAEGGTVGNEVANFAKTWSAGWQLHPVLDYEITTATAAWLIAFRTSWRAAVSYQPFRVYSSEGFFTGQLNPSAWIDNDTTLWAARYASSLGWTHPQLVLWQYTSSGSAAGISGLIDESQFENGWTPAADQGVTMNWSDDSGFVPPGATTSISYGQCIVFGVQAWLAGGTSLPGGGEALAQVLQDLKAGEANLGTQVGQVTAGQATLLSAVQGVQTGQVDVSALASALVPLLAPADAAALMTAMQKLLDAANPTS